MSHPRIQPVRRPSWNIGASGHSRPADSIPRGGLQSEVDAAKAALAADILRSHGRLTIRVVGSSMLPALRPGDLLTVHLCSAGHLSPGEIALCLRDDRLFAHRVSATTRTHVLTQGDAIGETDPPVPWEGCLGKVVEAHRNGRSLRIVTRRRLGTRLAAGLFRRSALARRFLLRSAQSPRTLAA